MHTYNSYAQKRLNYDTPSATPTHTQASCTPPPLNHSLSHYVSPPRSLAISVASHTPSPQNCCFRPRILSWLALTRLAPSRSPHVTPPSPGCVPSLPTIAQPAFPSIEASLRSRAPGVEPLKFNRSQAQCLLKTVPAGLATLFPLRPPSTIATGRDQFDGVQGRLNVRPLYMVAFLFDGVGR